jgi:hypothetical protein
MDWLDQHHVVIDYYNKEFICLDEVGNLRIIQYIPRVVYIREVSTLQLKKSYIKGCQLFAAHMEEEPKDKVPNVEDYIALKEFLDVFKEIPGLPPKLDIDLPPSHYQQIAALLSPVLHVLLLQLQLLRIVY